MRLLRGAGARTFASLRRHRNYRLYFAGQITSVCGTWMQNIALYWLILSITHSPLAVGLLSLARFGPFTVLGLFAGVVADRFDNRRTVIVTQSVQMAFSALLAAITLLGTVHPWEVYGIATLTGIAVVFDLPSRQNLTMQLVGRDELPNAVALNSSLFNTARILGPALAGIVIAAVGSGWCFAINSVSFLAVLAGLLAMRTSELYPLVNRGRPTLLRGTREGLAYVRHARPVLMLTAIGVVVMSFCVQRQRSAAGARKADARRRARAHSGSSRPASAQERSPARSSPPPARSRGGASCSAGSPSSDLPSSRSRRSTTSLRSARLLFLCGVCFTTYTSSSNAAVQLETPDHIRGRVLGIYYYAWNGPLPVASPLIGWLCTVGGTELAFGFGGACALAAALGGALAVRRSPPGSLRRRVPEAATV